MLSSEINIRQWPASGVSMGSLKRQTESIQTHRLSGPLAPPAGWSSVIIHSNSPILTDDGVDLINTEYNISNTSVINQIPSGLTSNNTEYYNASINENSFHQQQSFLADQQELFLTDQQQSFLTEQQQQNIVNIVENQHPPPLVVRKTLPNNLVTYKQNISVRYLQPPTPPPPAPIIIREVRPPPRPPQPPIQIRERPAPPLTPPPIVLRERPPPMPPQTPAKVVEKLLPPLPEPPRRVILERYGACPPKPSDVVIERWLPYKQSSQRRVLLERAPLPHRPPKEPNLLILHDSPRARISKQFINEGVVRADPNSYLQRYGTELNSSHSSSQLAYLVSEATRVVPPPPPPLLVSSRDRDYHASSPYISNRWERTRVASPIPRSSSYHYGSSHYDVPYHYCNQSSSKYGYDTPAHYYNQSSSGYGYDLPYHYYNQSSSRYGYDLPYHYCNQSSSRYGYDSYRSYADYPIGYESYRTMTDFPPSYYRSSSYDPYYRSSSYYPSNTIHVSSENEFHRVLSDLTNGHVPSTLGSY